MRAWKTGGRLPGYSTYNWPNDQGSLQIIWSGHILNEPTSKNAKYCSCSLRVWRTLFVLILVLLMLLVLSEDHEITSTPCSQLAPRPCLHFCSKATYEWSHVSLPPAAGMSSLWPRTTRTNIGRAQSKHPSTNLTMHCDHKSNTRLLRLKENQQLPRFVDPHY